MIRAALYARVSTTGNGQDVRVQLDQLREVAERQGWRVAGDFVDDGISGTKARDQRPGLRSVLRAVVRREVDLVAAWSVDRLGRSLQDLLGFLEELRVSGCELYLHQQGLDTRTPAGRAMFQLLGVFAEFERALIVERVRAGMARAQKSGTKSGKPIGRPRTAPEKIRAAERQLIAGSIVREVAASLKIRQQTVVAARARLIRSGSLQIPTSPRTAQGEPSVAAE